MRFTITTLMENTALKDCLAAEHGLSLLIEGAGQRVLYDTGGSPRFLQNAAALGADLDGLDALVLSHGHYDHTGGTAALLQRAQPPRAVWLGRDFFQPRFGKRQDGLIDISALVEQDWLTRAGIPVHVVGKDPVKLGDGLWLMSGFAPQDLEPISPKLLRRREGRVEQDCFQDEVVLVLETRSELFVLSGCAHVGVVNICARVAGQFGRPVTGFLGGTHLVEADEARIQRTCRLLGQRGVRRLGACHCTGDQAKAYLEDHFPGFFHNRTGSRVTVED